MTFEEQCEQYNPNYNYELRDWKPSTAIREFIKQKEGFRDHWYTANGQNLIGYGFSEVELKSMGVLDQFPPIDENPPEIGNSGIKEGQGRVSIEFCDQIFDAMIDKFAEKSKKISGFGGLDRNQRDALVSYFYNAGFDQPKLKKALEGADYGEVRNQMDAGYNNTSLPGLRVRRDEERTIFDGIYPDSVLDFIEKGDPGYEAKLQRLIELGIVEPPYTNQFQGQNGYQWAPDTSNENYNFFNPAQPQQDYLRTPYNNDTMESILSCGGFLKFR